MNNFSPQTKFLSIALEAIKKIDIVFLNDSRRIFVECMREKLGYNMSASLLIIHEIINFPPNSCQQNFSDLTFDLETNRIEIHSQNSVLTTISYHQSDRNGSSILNLANSSTGLMKLYIGRYIG